MPSTELDIWELLKRWAGGRMVIERVHAMPVNGSIANFRLGENNGSVRTACRAHGIEIDIVSPVLWQKRFVGLPTGKGKARTERKRMIRDQCRERYPALKNKITLQVADAIGILEYGLEVLLGKDCKGDGTA